MKGSGQEGPKRFGKRHPPWRLKGFTNRKVCNVWGNVLIKKHVLR